MPIEAKKVSNETVRLSVQIAQAIHNKDFETALKLAGKINEISIRIKKERMILRDAMPEFRNSHTISAIQLSAEAAWTQTNLSV